MSSKPKFFEKLRSLFVFSPSERRGILLLLPLLAVVAVIIAFANRPRFEKSFLEQVSEGQAAPLIETPTANEQQQMPELFDFDPNTATLQDFCALGLSQRTAAGIIKYRQRGKRFEIPEDFASCYGVTLEDYTRLEPYIKIGAEYALRKNAASVSSARPKNADAPNISLSEFDPNLLDENGFAGLGFSAPQASAIVRYRASRGGFRTAEDFAGSYVVSRQMFERLRPYIKIESGENHIPAGPPDTELIELNTADSAALRSVRGIGEVLVVRIMDYRRRLGGFVRAEQLAEIPGVTGENYISICEQISVDSCRIQKIDINFATPQKVVEALGEHPYITDKGLRKLLKNRQLKGGWRSIGDMVDENIVNREQAEKLAPYLIFGNE